MEIYNSELADDLQAMLNEQPAETSSRLQIENHVKKSGNIAQYLQSKNYHGFNFDADVNPAEPDDNEKPSFTSEDYKRIMALSNIDDHKPL